MAESGAKHFLDSSVVRTLLASTEKHKKLLNDRLDRQRRYASQFVRMEVRRSLVIPLIDFYFCLKAPDRTDIGDAIELWKNKFARGEHIALETLIAAFFSTRAMDLNSLRDKETALVEIARYIRNIERKLRSLKDPGNDSVRCSRAAVSLSVGRTALTKDLTRFHDDFADTDKHENACRVKHFFLSRYKIFAERYVIQAGAKPMPTDEARGFVAVGRKIAEILETNGKVCSCRSAARWVMPLSRLMRPGINDWSTLITRSTTSAHQ